jgi:hypothetical protein
MKPQSAQTPITLNLMPEELEIVQWALLLYFDVTKSLAVKNIYNKFEYLGQGNSPVQRDYTILPADLGRSPVKSSVGAELIAKQGQGGNQ